MDHAFAVDVLHHFEHTQHDVDGHIHTEGFLLNLNLLLNVASFNEVHDNIVLILVHERLVGMYDGRILQAVKNGTLLIDTEAHFHILCKFWQYFLDGHNLAFGRCSFVDTTHSTLAKGGIIYLVL